MEVAGMAIGSAGLAAVVGTCLSAFEYMDSGRQYGKEYQTMVLRLSVLELRLSRWGEPVQFGENTEGQRFAITPNQAEQVEALLGHIQAEITKAKSDSAKYTLPTSGRSEAATNGTRSLEELAQRFRSRALHRQRRTPVLGKVKWALRDKRRLNDLVAGVKESIDDLEKLLPWESFPAMSLEVMRKAAVEDAEQLVLQNRVDEVSGYHALNTDLVSVLKEVTQGTDALLHQAISVTRATTAADATIGETNTGEKAKVAIGIYIEKGYTGLQPGDRRSTAVIGKMNSTGTARVRVGDSYGGKDIFED
jgi:hypothetical protein